MTSRKNEALETKEATSMSAAWRQRLDKWMWHARVAKTRSICAKLVSQGHVRINQEKILKPGRQVGYGDVLTIVIGERVLIYKILDQAEQRGNYEAAQKLFENLSPPPPRKDDPPNSYPQREQGAGRPTKRERRKLSAIKDL